MPWGGDAWWPLREQDEASLPAVLPPPWAHRRFTGSGVRAHFPPGLRCPGQSQPLSVPLAVSPKAPESHCHCQVSSAQLPPVWALVLLARSHTVWPSSELPLDSSSPCRMPSHTSAVRCSLALHGAQRALPRVSQLPWFSLTLPFLEAFCKPLWPLGVGRGPCQHSGVLGAPHRVTAACFGWCGALLRSALPCTLTSHQLGPRCGLFTHWLWDFNQIAFLSELSFL